MAQTPSTGDGTHDDPLPGFDIDNALINLRCDLQAFKKILLTFYRERKDNYDEITTFLSQGDIEQVRDIVHGIKGSSGYLGAWKLHNEAAAMQEACESGEISAVNAQLSRFYTSFREVMDGLKNLEERS